jgi:hypothetical protein
MKCLQAVFNIFEIQIPRQQQQPLTDNFIYEILMGEENPIAIDEMELWSFPFYINRKKRVTTTKSLPKEFIQVADKVYADADNLFFGEWT